MTNNQLFLGGYQIWRDYLFPIAFAIAFVVDSPRGYPKGGRGKKNVTIGTNEHNNRYELRSLRCEPTSSN